jgi:sugar lactone lactonase YvrE
MTSNNTISTLAHGFAFLECPRWHNGRLWVSDMHRGVIVALGENGEMEETVSIPGRPGGFGWLPDGTLLIVSTLDRRIIRYREGGMTTYADLADVGVTDHELNDMVVDPTGRCYVGESGVDVHAWMAEHMPRVAGEGVGVLGKAPLPEAAVFVVSTDGAISTAAAGLRFPNGGAVDLVRHRYIVAETFGLRLSVFDRSEDGQLSAPRVFDLGFPPDGISRIDREGAVWVSDPLGRAVHRVDADGQITDSIVFELPVYACELGGADGRTLFACLASSVDPLQTVDLLDSRIDAARVGIPAAD